MMLQPSSMHSIMAFSMAVVSESLMLFLRMIWLSLRPRVFCMATIPWSWV